MFPLSIPKLLVRFLKLQRNSLFFFARPITLIIHINHHFLLRSSSRRYFYTILGRIAYVTVNWYINAFRSYRTRRYGRLNVSKRLNFQRLTHFVR